MSTVGTIIRGVRDLSPHFDDRYTSSAVILRALARYQNRLWGQIRDLKADAIRDTLEVQIDQLQWSAEGGWLGLTFATEFTDGSVYFQDTSRETEPFTIVPYSQRFQSFFRWGGWIAHPKTPGQTVSVLWLLGAESDWQGVDHIDVHHFPIVQNVLTGLTSQIDLPLDHDDVMVAYGATVCARRAFELGLDVAVDRLDAEWKEAEKAYIDRVTGRRHAKVGVATEVW